MKNIPLMIPSINENDIEAVVNVLRSGMLIQGKHVLELESKIANIANTKYAVAVSNGTATMHLILVALGIGVGDEVILPAFSYIATANVIELVGATPVFIDIDSATNNIDVAKIEAVITKNTKAIMPVHEFGLAANITQIMEIAKKHQLHVIEDAACALGAKENKKAVGGFGLAGSFSLHPRKNVTSGEGGVITTNDENLYHTLRTLRNHGVDSKNESMDFILPGFNYRLTDFQAALVNSQINRIDEMVAKKRLLAAIYFEELKNEKLLLPVVDNNKNHTWQTFHVVLPEHCDRNLLIKQLSAHGIGSNYGAQCIPAQTYYFNKYKLNSAKEFPHAYNAFTKGLALPIYEKLEEEDITYITNTLKDCINHA